jgi:hypothetical protein
MRFVPPTSCIALVVFGLLPACSGISVDSDYDPSVDFSALRNYAWMDDEIPQTAELVQGSLLIHRVRAAVDPWLAANGRALVPSEQADFLVRQSVITRERIEAWSGSVGYSTGHPWWNGLPIYTDTTLAIYAETILILDFLTPDGERLLWRGIGELDSFGADTPQERSLRVQETAEAILAQFPPGPQGQGPAVVTD